MIAYEFESQQELDRFEVETPRALSNEVLSFETVPGFTAQRLALSSSAMPIALAWNLDGQLLFASLKGRVWSARDTNGDGLEDTSTVISDELAAPYGLNTGKSYVDVATKFGVVRLSKFGVDGLARRSELVASGWGHTDDYHDWVVGLPKDRQGNYFVAIPCQQDERSKAAASFRGAVLALQPRKPTPQSPRKFEIQRVSVGHRFPMGIALRRDGELFVTDNQGNYNPFNELNHVRQDKHFGFINRLDRENGGKRDLAEPAIDIPHPWTRSVNGICFLESPSKQSVFGPYEGHLVGCEYDTRRLVRMSVERVGGELQGAIYPFSYDSPAADVPTFLGPICCGVSPDGAIYVGEIRDSGWGGSNNIGAITRLEPNLEELPQGIAEIRARPDAFAISFQRDLTSSFEVDDFSVESFRRISTPEYGGDDVDRRTERLLGVKRVDDRTIHLLFDELRPGFVYRIQIVGDRSEGLHPALGFYTLRRLATEVTAR